MNTELTTIKTRKIFIDIDKIAESHQSEILNEKISQLRKSGSRSL